MDRHLFFTWRSTNLTSSAVGMGFEPWRLSFLSLQRVWMVAWKTNRTRNLTLQSRVLLTSKRIKLSQSALKCEPRSPRVNLVHAAIVYAHSKNRWLRVSTLCWQNIQAGSISHTIAVVFYRLMVSNGRSFLRWACCWWQLEPSKTRLG